MSFLDFFKFNKKNKKQNFTPQTDTIVFRDNYSTLNKIYKGKTYILKEHTKTIILNIPDFNYFWDKYIINHEIFLDENNQSFVTIHIINEKKEYLYNNYIKEKTEINNNTLIPLKTTDEPLLFFTEGIIEIGFWNFYKKIFTPVWSAKYTS